jgi:2-aminoadipate transaminase
MKFWTSHYAGRTSELRASEIRQLLHLTEQPDVISFAGGLPAPEAFPLQECRAACERVLEQHGAQSLQYSTTEGFLPLREMISRHMARYGITARPSNILITSGSQQALDLVGKLLLDPGDVVAVEEPTYLGALQAFRAYQARFVGVPADVDGIRVDLLQQVLENQRVKLLYLLPNFQNPSGVTMSELRRQRVIELAARHEVPILEDDPYGQLRYEGEHRTPLVVLDEERARGGAQASLEEAHVLYTSTLSKLVAPGFRIGWVTGPDKVINSLVQLKQGTDLHTSTFSQMVAYETCRGGFLDQHVRDLRRLYSERRDAMLAALEQHMPPGTRWTRPEGGLFLWVTLPGDLDAREVLKHAIGSKVAFVPGSAFYPNGGGQSSMRLNYSYSAPGVIWTGIQRLGKVVEKCLASPAGSGTP